MIDLDSLIDKENLCIFIRHGEKNPNGYDLSNTGRMQSLLLAEKLSNLSLRIQIFSSPEERCIETATIINNKINGKSGDIHVSDILGKPGVHVRDKFEYAKLTDSMRCRDIFDKWKKGECYKAIHEPDVLKKEITYFFKKTMLQGGVALYISQSGTIACTGYSLGLTDYNTANNEWVDYLDGYSLRL